MLCKNLSKILVREEANGRKYFYDEDITEIKKNPAQTGGPDSKTGYSLREFSLLIVYRNG